jgi:hypothetical protein
MFICTTVFQISLVSLNVNNDHEMCDINCCRQLEGTNTVAAAAVIHPVANDEQHTGNNNDGNVAAIRNPHPVHDNKKNDINNMVNNEKKRTPFSLEIKLLTYNRLESLQRCIKSLRDADYDGDNVDLVVFVDHYPLVSNMSKEEHNNKRLIHERMLAFLRKFEWNHGKFTVHYRHKNAGLQLAWLEAFYPLNNDTYGFIVEDDMAVSPFYYLYLKQLLYKYRYSGQRNPNIYAISLQRQRLVPGVRGKVVSLNNDDQPFLYQLVGTWGLILFPEHWLQFRKYFDERRFLNDENVKPYLDGTLTGKWYRIRKETLWTPWIIRWAYANNMYCLYTNLPNRDALSVSFRDAGSNFKDSKGADASLITLDRSSVWQDYYNRELIDISELQKFDYCFNEVPNGKIYEISDKLNLRSNNILRKEENALVLVDSKDPIKFFKNQLCYIEQNVSRITEFKMRESLLFLTDSPSIASELSIRGFNVLLNKDNIQRLGDILAEIAKRMGNRHKLLVINQKNTLLKNISLKSDQLKHGGIKVSKNMAWALLEGSGLWNHLNQVEKMEDLQHVHIAQISSDNIEGIVTIQGRNDLVISLDDYACKAIQCKR